MWYLGISWVLKMRKGRKIYNVQRLSDKVADRCQVFFSADKTAVLYYDPVRNRFLKIRGD